MTDYSKRHADRGFTLLELLVVVAIIALLVVLLAPSIRNALHSVRAGICGNNLRRIGEGVALFSDGRPVGGESTLNAERWPAQLSEYLGEGRVTYCPEGDPGAQQISLQSAPVSDLVCIYVRPPQDFDLEFIETPLVRKLSEEQYQAVSWGPAHINLPVYDPGADMGVYWLVFEDLLGGGDMDFDIAVRVTENGDGTYTLRCDQITGAGYNWDLVDKLDVDENGNRAILVTKQQMTGSGEFDVIVGEGGGANYGMNSKVNSISGDVGKVMVLDYPWFAARSSHDWDGNMLAGDIPGIPVFARHQGEINVLFTGGSVHLKRPDEVNPLFHQATLWDQ